MKARNYFLVAAGLLALAAAPALAYEEGTWILRGGVGTVQPKSHSFTYSDDIDSISFDIDDATSMTIIGYEKIGTAQVDPLLYSLNIGFHF